MKKITLLLLLLVGSFGIAQTISHSNSMDLGDTNVACNIGTITSGENSYFRFFQLNSFSITGDYSITSVQFGVQSLTIPTLPGGFPVTIKISSTANTNFPTGYPTGYTELTQITTNIQTTDVGTLVSIPISATIPAGSNLLVEVGYLAQETGSGNRIFLSANDLGQTAVTYLAAPGCGITSPTSMTTVGFPDAHLVLSVTGEVLGLNDSLLQQVSVYPNPTKEKVTVSLPNSISVVKSSLTDISGKQMAISLDANNSFSFSEYAAGIYILNLETSEGVLNKRIVKE